MVEEKTVKGYKYRIYPNKTQIDLFEKAIFVNRLVWNKLLYDYKQFRYELDIIPYFKRSELFNYFTKSKNIDKDLKASFYFESYKGKNYNFYGDFKELTKQEPYNQVSSTTISNAIDTLKKAFQNMSKTKAGYPRFKKENEHNSFSILYVGTNQTSNSFKLKNIGFTDCNIPWNSKIKINSLSIKVHRLLPEGSIIKSATISKNNKNEWFISFIVSYDKPKVEFIGREEYLGIDRNVKHNVVCTSNEELNKINEELFSKDLKLKEYYDLLKDIQIKYNKVRENLLIKYYGELKQNQKLTEEQKSSKMNFLEKQISKYNTKIKNYRINKNWNIANVLTNSADTIVFEDLKLKNMSKRAKDKGKSDGTVKRKSGLNRSLMQSGLYDIKLKTEIKGKEKNNLIVEVSAKNTSNRCNCCGHIDKANRLTQETFLCVKCNHSDNADLNASKNIIDKHLQKW